MFEVLLWAEIEKNIGLHPEVQTILIFRSMMFLKYIYLWHGTVTVWAQTLLTDEIPQQRCYMRTVSPFVCVTKK